MSGSKATQILLNKITNISRERYLAKLSLGEYEMMATKSKQTYKKIENLKKTIAEYNKAFDLNYDKLLKRVDASVIEHYMFYNKE